MTFRPDAILEVLQRHEVEYVVIGGLAATLHGAGTVTFDIDVIPEQTVENLGRLSAALDELEARVRAEGFPDGLPFSHSAQSLAGLGTLNLVTKYGDLDITAYPAAIPSYEEWASHATQVEALGVHFQVASLEDVIRSKETAGRPKDHMTLPALRALLERTRGKA